MAAAAAAAVAAAAGAGSVSVSGPGSGASTSPTSVQIPPGFGGTGTGAPPVGAGSTGSSTLNTLMSQHRLLEFSRFGGLRGYDIAQHMLTQQGAVSKLLGEYKHIPSPSEITNGHFVFDLFANFNDKHVIILRLPARVRVRVSPCSRVRSRVI